MIASVTEFSAPDIERDGHKGVEDNDGGEDLEERDLRWRVLKRVVVACIVLKPHAIYTLEYERTNQTDEHARHQEDEDLRGERVDCTHKV